MIFHFAKGPDRETDTMNSTWRNSKDKKEWGPFHYAIQLLNIHPSELNQETPVHPKSDKVPYITQTYLHVWILYHALWPVAVQSLYRAYTGHDFSPITAFVFYMLCFKANAAHELWVLRRLGHRVGYFDGDKHGRDEVPDHAVGKTFMSLYMTTSIRPLIAVIMTYRPNGTAARFSWWLPVEMFLYPIVLDLFFYCYHRACHESESLWRYHRTHHLTKHPSPMLSSYADAEQEFIEIALVPFLTYASLRLMGLPMPFHDWWICHSYILFNEAIGHSGLRVWYTPSGPSQPFLKAIGCELTIEDHDLHHRKGWKSSYNYGKATRVYDRLLGTCHERIEGYEDNVDWSNPIDFPLY